MWPTILSRGFTRKSVKVWDYETIPLKLFLEIGQTRDYSLVGGLEGWESILRKNEENSGGHEYIEHLDKAKQIAAYMNEFLIVQACVSVLSVTEDEAIEEVMREHGYNPKRLEASLRKARNLKSRIASLQKEMEKSGDEKPSNYNRIMAVIRKALAPMQIADDITLSYYNELIKIAKENANSSRVIE